MRLQTHVAPEIQKRLLLSRVEAESLKERDILCPFEEAENILSGKIYRNQDVIHLKDWDVLVLKEK